MTRRGESGFTLIELVMVIVILGVVAAFIGNSFRGAVDMVRNEKAMGDACAEVRRIASLLTGELRLVDGNDSIGAWTATSCSFSSVRGDSVIFAWSGAAGGPLTVSYDAQLDTISPSVDSLAFAYYNTVGGAANADTNIYSIGVYVRLNRNGTKVAQRVFAHVRN